MIQATVNAIEADGKQVFTFAPSAEASRGVLRSEGFTNAETVENQVLWVDEAGLLSVKDMKRLFDVAKDQNARVILSGDTNQHNAVYRGDALRILETDAGMKTGELKQIRRQTSDSYREAVKAISEGDKRGKDGKTKLEAGVEILDRMGAIIETSGEEALSPDCRRLCGRDAATQSRWRGEVGARGVAHTPRSRPRYRCHPRDAQSGRLAGAERELTALRPMNFTEAQRHDAREYVHGAVVQFHQNAKGFKRGERITVTGSDKNGGHASRVDGSAVVVPLDQAKR